MIRCLAVFLLSLAFALCWTPLMRKAALRLAIVDRPDGELKQHGAPVPYLGGVAIFAAFLMAVGILAGFKDGGTTGLLLSGGIVLLTGLIDDFSALTPFQKMLGQALAAFVLVRSGTCIKFGPLPVYLAMPLTVFWLLAVTNAFNIIDIMDGLASGVAVIAAVAIAIANHVAGHEPRALLAVALAGASMGFLQCNFHPAKIFLGDAGSMFMGFTLAALSLSSVSATAGMPAILSPLLVLGVPLFDLLLVMFIRWKRGIPMTKGSPDHFALRLRRLGLSVPQTVLAAYSAGVIVGSAGLLMGKVRLAGAIGIAGVTVSLACFSAVLLMKADMRP